MNDISESRREVFDEAAISELNKYRSISFTEDKRGRRGFEIDTLWGYYAEKGNGMCLVFDKNKLASQFRKLEGFRRQGKIKYKSDFTNAIFFEASNDSITKQVERRARDIFFTKSVDWRVESEYRLLLRTSQTDKAFIPISEDVLVAVIICMPLAENIESTCEYKILNKLVDIPILHYQTSLGNKTLYEIQGSRLWPLLGVDVNLDI